MNIIGLHFGSQGFFSEISEIFFGCYGDLLRRP